jgi:hypothetical protein
MFELRSWSDWKEYRRHAAQRVALAIWQNIRYISPYGNGRKTENGADPDQHRGEALCP